MELITKARALEWCREHGIAVATASVDASRLTFGHPMHGLRVDITGPPSDVLALVYVLVMTGIPDDDERHFNGAMIWLRDWDIGSCGAEAVGYALAQGLRGTGGATPSVLEQPAHLVADDEFVLARAMLALPMLFRWDAVFVPAHGLFLASVSHHEHLDIYFRDGRLEPKLRKRFEAGGYPVHGLGVVQGEV